MGTNALPPHLQSALEKLLGLFGAYVTARTRREREELHVQITDIFSQLGVVSGSPSVRRAIELFDNIKVESIRTRPQIPSLAIQARKFTSARLHGYERSLGVDLSPGAKQLLRIPVAESAQFAERFDPAETDESLRKIFTTLREEPSAFREGDATIRTSIDVVRAFWKNFCNIPPFCSRGDDRGRRES